MEDHPDYQARPEPDAEPELEYWPTTDELVAMARAHRQGEAYPTPARLIENLPVVLRALCDYLLDAYPMAVDVVQRLASVIDAVEHVQDGPVGQEQSCH